MATRTMPGRLLASAALLAAVAAAPPARGAEAPATLVAARYVERGSGAEAGWGATGQLLLPGVPAGAEHRRGERAVATSPAIQEVVIPEGGRGEIRVGRDVPFVGWFLRRARRAGLAREEEEWRDVEALLDVEVLPGAAPGEARLALTPELAFTHGRSRRSVAFAGERVEIALAAGAEARLGPGAGAEDFFGRLLVGYDPERRVRAVDLLLRAAPVGGETGP